MGSILLQERILYKVIFSSPCFEEVIGYQVCSEEYQEEKSYKSIGKEGDGEIISLYNSLNSCLENRIGG